MRARRTIDRRFSAVVALVVGLVASTSIPGGAHTRPGRTELGARHTCGGFIADLDGGGDPENTVNAFSDISATGRYLAFTSMDPLLVPGDTNFVCDVFVRDLVTGAVERISVSSDGDQGLAPPGSLMGLWAGSWWPSISADGRFVAFGSHATNFSPSDTNDQADVFLHDRRTNKTTRVSIASDGTELEGGPWLEPSLSANGRFVAFMNASALSEPSQTGIYLRDLRDGSTRAVDTFARYATSTTEDPSISANGRYLVYTVDQILVVVTDLRKGTHEVASVYTDGSEPGDLLRFHGNNYGRALGGRWISSNGRYVVFSGTSTQFVPSDANGRCDLVRPSMPDVFVRDLKEDRTERVSVYWTGEEAEFGGGTGGGYGFTEDCSSVAANISGNGRFVSFSSHTNFFDGDTGTTPSAAWVGGQPGMWGDVDSYVYDRLTGALNWTSVTPDGTEGTSECPASLMQIEMHPRVSSQASALSHSGRFSTFFTCANDLTERDDEADESTDSVGEIVWSPWDLLVRDVGPVVGAGGLGGGPGEPDEPACPTDDLCIDPICVSPDLCVPPQGVVAEDDPSEGPRLIAKGGDLIEARIAYRPQFGDLFVIEELEELPGPMVGTMKVGVGPAPLVYGMRFDVAGKQYEVRATALLGGTFGLFDCSGSSPACVKVADLRGGYGTTGERVVFSLPLDEIGLKEGGELSDVTAFSGIGTQVTGQTKILDSLRFK